MPPTFPWYEIVDCRALEQGDRAARVAAPQSAHAREIQHACVVRSELPDAGERPVGAGDIARLVGAIDGVDEATDFFLGDGNSGH